MKYFKNVVSLELDTKKCTGCRWCVTVCPHAVFKIENRKAEIVNFNRCMECGACALNCQFGAISVRSGVGCAAGIINGILTNSEPNCDCSSTGKKEIECC